MDLEPELKQDIMEDLQRFSRGEKYYRQAGWAWKWGYLLYDPPGMGKSSMISAMANFLDYDISDLELTQVKRNTKLRKLLIATTKKSIIVIEYIDFSLNLSDRKKKKPQKYDEEDKKPSKPGKPNESRANQDNKVTLSGVLIASAPNASTPPAAAKTTSSPAPFRSASIPPAPLANQASLSEYFVAPSPSSGSPE